MSRSLDHPLRWRSWAAPTALAAGALLALALAPVAAPRLSHAAFLALMPVPVGCMLLRLVHVLTSGEWGRDARPALAAGMLALPFVSLLAVPPLLFMPSVFLWSADPSLIPHGDVARWYLNMPGLAVRTLLTLLVWNGLARLAVRSAGPSPLVAGFGLVLFGVTVSTAGVDWVLALAEPARSTAFPMSLTVSCLLAGAAFAGGRAAGKRAADWVMLTSAFALALTYLDAMQFLVAYDGNLPEQARWYGARGGWHLALLAPAFVLGALFPALAVMRGRWRRSPTIRRALALAVPVGVGLRALWFAVPSWEPAGLFWLFLLVLLAALTGWIGLRKGAAA